VELDQVHRFVRYADDCNIYVRSERAGQRVMQSITHFIKQKLKLKVKEAKTAVARPQERKFLGFSFTAGPEAKRTIAPKSLERFKRRIREITRRAKGVSIKTTMEELVPYMRGWCGYFGFCQTPEVLIALTRWVRLRLRAALWRQWKTPRRRRAALIALRVSGELLNTAGSGRGPWNIARSKALSVGLSKPTSNCSVSQPWSKRVSAISRTAVYGPVRTVVWELRLASALKSAV
jgi:RNA-directed DNA polymerase